MGQTASIFHMIPKMNDKRLLQLFQNAISIIDKGSERMPEAEKVIANISQEWNRRLGPDRYCSL